MADALLHYYDGTGTHLDDDGDNRIGWYWQLPDSSSSLVGPYTSREEAEKACIDSWPNDDF